MQQPSFRVAMIGGGLNSAVGRVHEIALKMDNRFTLVAGCFSRNPEVNRSTGQAYGVDSARVYDDPAALLRAESGRLDAVVVVTPILAHEEHVHLVLDHGLTVITDKPLLGTVGQCERLLARVGGDSPAVFTIFNYTGYPA
ncbi:MAG: Gfo/Idh/MocA family protein, partial [Gammaproteobacteria bacterium]